MIHFVLILEILKNVYIKHFDKNGFNYSFGCDKLMLCFSCFKFEGKLFVSNENESFVYFRFDRINRFTHNSSLNHSSISISTIPLSVIIEVWSNFDETTITRKKSVLRF